MTVRTLDWLVGMVSAFLMTAHVPMLDEISSWKQFGLLGAAIGYFIVRDHARDKRDARREHDMTKRIRELEEYRSAVVGKMMNHQLELAEKNVQALSEVNSAIKFCREQGRGKVRT